MVIAVYTVYTSNRISGRKAETWTQDFQNSKWEQCFVWTQYFQHRVNVVASTCCIKYSSCTYLQEQVNLTLVRYCQNCTALWWGCVVLHSGTMCQYAHGTLILEHNRYNVVGTRHISWNNSNGDNTTFYSTRTSQIQIKHTNLFYVINLLAPEFGI
jgi:hypothetical protein